MAALLVVIGLILGTAAPVSLAVITPLQWAIISLTLAQNVPTVIKGVNGALRINAELIKLLQSPQFQVQLKAMAATNGAAAIKWQDRLLLDQQR